MAKRIPRRKVMAVIEAYKNSPDGVKNIAKRFSLGATTVRNLLRRNGVPADPAKIGVPFGSHWKYTHAQSQQIAKLYAKGVRPSALKARFECSDWTIRNAVRRHGYSLLRRGGQLRPWSEVERRDILRRAEKGESQQSIAEHYRTHQTRISGLLRMAGFETRKVRERHGSWRGGRSMIQGYVGVLVESEDPYASMRMGNGYVLEHRLVMARHLGRPLTPRETVHHINGKKNDNRIENLQLRNGRHGKHEALVCGDCGSRNIVHTPLA